MIDKFLTAFLVNYFKTEGYYKSFQFETVHFNHYEIKGNSIFIYSVCIVNINYSAALNKDCIVEYEPVGDTLVFVMLDLMAFIYSELKGR